MRYILDTDTVTFQQLGRATVLRRLASAPAPAVATTVITMYEQLRGRLAAIDRARDVAALLLACKRLQQMQTYYCRVPVVPFDESAAAQYRALVAERLHVGTQDLRIAAIALSRDATLVTSNRRDFGRIPGLRIEDWNIADGSTSNP